MNCYKDYEGGWYLWLSVGVGSVCFFKCFYWMFLFERRLKWKRKKNPALVKNR